MIKINCKTQDTLKLTDMTFFQGNLKKRTRQDLDELKDSLKSEGLMMPFAIWKHEDKNLLLDGHGRKQVLLEMIGDDPDLVKIDWPVIYIEADTEDDARKALLQITSTYGKITKQGVKQFMVSIPNYVAPSVKKFVAPAPVKKTEVKVDQKPADTVIMKIRVKRDKLDQVKEVFGQFDFIEVL